MKFDTVFAKFLGNLGLKRGKYLYIFIKCLVIFMHICMIFCKGIYLVFSFDPRFAEILSQNLAMLARKNLPQD